MSNFQIAIENWRDANCNGTAIVPAPLDTLEFIEEVLNRTYTRSPTYKVIIIVNTFATRQKVIEHLKTNFIVNTAITNGYIRIFTYDYISKNHNSIPNMIIYYLIDKFDQNMVTFNTSIKFKLCVLTSWIVDDGVMDRIIDSMPILACFKQAEVDQIRCSTPVEEQRIGITIDEDSEDARLLDYYTKYINTSINLFGSLDVMDKCNKGDYLTNTSATQMCYALATENGWSANLDMNIGINVKIDELYNPVNIAERAKQTYTVIRNRQELLASNQSKLPYIADIVRNNKDKKILIINKKATFAKEVTEYLNSVFGECIAAGYHDGLDPIIMCDINGNPILYKTGAKAGQYRTMGAKAQQTNNESRFNTGDIKVLVCGNSPDKELNATVDVVIITSPFCESMKSYFYRLGNVKYKGILTLYTLYIINSQEERLNLNKELTNNHNILNNDNNEENNDFIIVD